MLQHIVRKDKPGLRSVHEWRQPKYRRQERSPRGALISVRADETGEMGRSRPLSYCSELGHGGEDIHGAWAAMVLNVMRCGERGSRAVVITIQLEARMSLYGFVHDG